MIDWRMRWTVLALAAAACGCASAGPASQTGDAKAGCDIAQADLAWLEASLAAVGEAAEGLGAPARLDRAEIIVFDADCVLTIAPDQSRRLEAHEGAVPAPTGSIPAAITSFAAPMPDPAPGGAASFFVMALPSLWESAGFQSEIPVHDFTLGVFAHEISHIWQLSTYFEAIKRVDGVEHLPPPVDDDMVQRIYGDDPSFRTSVEADIAAFQLAARQEDAEAVRALTRQTLEAMRARWATTFTGSHVALVQTEAIFLTLEGSGQWFALRALTGSPSGPGLEPDLALRAFGQRGGKWSQDLGLAMTAVLDRLDPDWPAAVYGEGGVSVLDLLDAAAAEP